MCLNILKKCPSNFCLSSVDENVFLPCFFATLRLERSEREITYPTKNRFHVEHISPVSKLLACSTWNRLQRVSE